MSAARVDKWLSLAISDIAVFGSGNLISVARLSARSGSHPVPVYGGNGVAGYTSLAMIDRPTVILGRVGQKCGVVYRNDGPAWITDNALYARQFKRPLDVHFLAFALEAARLNDVRNRNDLPLITQSILNDVKIAWTDSLEEQHQIARVLKDADDLITALERKIAKERATKQGMMQQLLAGRTRLPGFTSEWEHVTWGDVSERCTSGATPLRSRVDFYGGEIPWVTSTELKYGTIAKIPQSITPAGRDAARLMVWPRGTFLMAITGLEAAGTRGSCGLLGMPAATNQSCMAVVPNHRLRSDYLYYYYVLHGEELALRYCQGTKQQSYTAGIVKSLPIYLPTDVEEQRAIATALRHADETIDILNERRTKAQAVKQGMMQELLTGRTRLPAVEGAA